MNANNKVWTEYAGTLASKLGCYPEPEERYCRLVRARMQASHGDRLGLREFHHAVLHPDAVPLRVRAFHLDHITAIA